MQQQREGQMAAARGMRDLAMARALELEAKHPQLSAYDNEVEDTSPEAIRGSGGDAGLARVIGKGKKKAAPKKGASNGKMMMPKNEVMEMSDSDEMEGGMMHGGASKQGKMLAEHLEKMHGAGWLKDFAKGLLSGIKTVGSVVGNLPGPIGMIGKLASGAVEAGEQMGAKAAAGGRRRGRPRKTMPKMLSGGDNQIMHAQMSDVGLPGSARTGSDVPPGGLAPMAYGNVPQAPASFQRNTVGMGKLTIHHGGAMEAPAKKKRAPSQRNMMISKLCKERGMSLPEASAYLKAHGSA
jgi:hypothetical protein